MNSVTNETRLVERPYRNKIKKDKKKFLWILKNIKNKMKKIENCNDYNHQLRKTKKSAKLQKKKEYEVDKRRKLIRRQTETNKEKNKMKENKKEKIW